MTWSNGERLYNLLPAIYRIRDHAHGEPLRALLAVLEQERETLERDVATLYEHLCPAGVYEARDGELVVNAPNCVDCKATDVLGPRWTPREGGSGPKYRRM